ncbi:MAG TPA: ATP-binding protein [Kofleriaceae bacterium]|nr:ATP-binding protein [Kofleriaceae bacterium]
MTSARTLSAAVLIVGALAAVLIAWFGSGWRSMEKEQEAILASARADAADTASVLADDLVAELEHLRADESQRPYYHYQNLFHDPRGASLGWSVVPSPLAEGPTERLVATHFQIDAAGALTSPTFNPEVPDNNAPRAATDLAMLAALGPVKTALVAAPDPVQVAMAQPVSLRPEPPEVKGTKEKDVDATQQVKPATKGEYKSKNADVGSPKDAVAEPFESDKVAMAKKRRAAKQVSEPTQQVVQIDPSAYVQNMQSNEIFVSSRAGNQEPIQMQGPVPDGNGPVPAQAMQPIPPQGQIANPQARAPRPRSSSSAPQVPLPITITINPLAWRAVTLDGKPALLAVRSVTTPDGQLTQGLVVSTDRVSEWLAERAPEASAKLVTGADSPPSAAASVALADIGWWVAIDDTAALAGARRAAAGLRSSFLGRFIPVSLLALMCAMLVVLLTFRAEKMARQRERFAAAAAHELRTPLAGIQLYGDMLVDGLGDPAKHRDYARRVAEEASRLGRVVANVLGFSQLERKSLAVRPDVGDVVEAVRAAVERAEPALMRAGAAVELDAPERATARFDRDALARILGNLLDNAEKYTRDVEDRHITVAVAAVDGAVEITVADRGPGLPASLRRRRFEPFARGIGDDGPPGLGLGLALSQSLAQAMGGELTWKDQSPGATFVVRLPST